jgi:hypothetical protein
MTEPYTYRDAAGAEMTLSPHSSPAGEFVAVRADDEPVLIDPDTLPEFVARLYAAARKPAPILLERPDVSIDEGVALFDGMVGASRDGKKVHLQSLGGKHIGQPDEVLADAARLAALAELVAAEPDPEAVAALAQFLRDANPLSEDWDDRALAAAVLRRYDLKERAS